MFLLLTASVLAVAAPATAARPILWGDLAVGMTRAEVKARYPKSHLAMGGECKAWISPAYANGGLRSVTLESWGTGDYAACGEVVARGMVEKYGAPVAVAREAKLGANCALAAKPRLCRALRTDAAAVREVAIWRAGAVQATLTQPLAGSTLARAGWTLVYEVVPPPPPINVTAIDKL